MDVMMYLASVITLGIAAQWLAWRLHLPAILLLLVGGFLLLPLYGLVTGERPDANSLMDADVLFPIVSLSVAIILFEGGLTLRFAELRGTGSVVLRLVTLGVVVTWVLATVAARYVFDFHWPLAALLGGVLTVSGPTVVGPLLRYVRPEARIGSVAKWEGIVNDPVGAVLAVLVFEGIRIGGFEQAAVATMRGILVTALVGVCMGSAAALVLVQLLKRYLIPDYLQSAVSLAVVVALFVLSNSIQHESGLLTVTVLGIALANQKSVTLKHVVEFKENLRVLLISTLFILLASRVGWNELQSVGWPGLLFLLLLLLIRPVAVYASTVGSGLQRPDRLFLSWLHPRGIVAAAVASLFALELDHLARMDDATPLIQTLAIQAKQMVPITFLVIVGTVAVYGLTITPLARWLQLAKPNRGGVLFAGAERFVREMAKMVQAEGYPVLLVDTNQRHTARARMEGLPTFYGSVLSEYVQEELDLSGIGRFVAMTPNDEINSLAAMELADVFGRAEVYQLAPETLDAARHSQIPQHLRARLLFEESVTNTYLRARIAQGAVIKRTRLSGDFTHDHFREMYGESAMILFLIRETGELDICTSESAVQPQPGQTVIALVDLEASFDSQGDGNDTGGPSARRGSR